MSLLPAVRTPYLVILLAALVGVVAIVACGDGGNGLTGSVKIDGSSTVFPIAEAMGEEFQLLNRRVRLTVGISGTGGGFKKFCRKETDITNASRPIKASEVETCADNGVEFIELPIAIDGLSVMVNPKNDWVDHLTVEELKRIWEPASKVKRWSDVRPEWPDKRISLVGPDTDSGTFDYFTEAIVGEEGASRPDFTASADDNVLVQAIAGEENALGYFGYAFFVANMDKLKLVPIDSGNGPVAPTEQTVGDGTYQPLSRPLLIYISKRSVTEKPEVLEFVNFFLDEESGLLVEEGGYVTLTSEIYQLVRQRFNDRVTGSMFAGGSQVGVSLEELLSRR